MIKQYWDDPTAVGSEAFAHFFSALVRNEKQELLILKSAFPTAFAIFEKMLRNTK